MSAAEIANRKRVTVKPKSCPNPLFEKWLQEWRDEAANRNSDLKYCFDKALQSLRKYPLRLNSGRECLILKNFGTQLCVKLDRKLAEHNKNTGSAGSSNFIGDQNSNQNVPSAQPMQTKPKKVYKRKKDQNQDQKTDESAPTTPKKMKSYVPGWRSGPYAILITLYQEQMKPSYPGFLKKAELQEKAQPLCDNSFVKPDPGSHYTAWSSMSTLLKKGLVIKKGNPAKFSLSKEGEDLAKKLNDQSNYSTSISPLKPAPHKTKDSVPAPKKSFSPIKPILDKPTTSIPAPEKYYAIALSDDETDFPPLSPMPYFPSPVKQKSKQSPIKKILPIVMSDSDSESNLAPIVTKSKSKSPKKVKTPPKKNYPATISDSEDDIGSDNPKPSSFNPDIDCIDLTDDNIEEHVSWVNPQPDSNTWFNEYNKKKNNENDFSKPSSSEANLFSSLAETEQFIFLPGDFEIILLVDTAETTGKFRNALSDDPAKELTKLGTKFEVRHLKVGDFLWISRQKSGKELILPYVVERKRMDDLGGSIKDGRFHEQKFRLRQCGLQNVIYLVEKYANENRLGLPINTLHQAAINTQVVDNFHVKYTKSYTHSMMYLSVMTNLLSDMFKDKTLISCPKNNLPLFNFNDDLVSLITFEEFTKISAKNKVLKVHEMFIKHLLQLKGLSVDKAVAITERYPTPRRLIAAFKESSKPELMLANIQCGPLKRNIGPAISKAVYQLYSINKFP